MQHRDNSLTQATLRFASSELNALSVADDIKLRLTDDFRDHIPDGGQCRISELPSWPGDRPDEGVAIAVWQMLFPEDRTKRVGCPRKTFKPVPKWLWAAGITYFRGWIRHAGPDGPDFVMDWVIPGRDGLVQIHRDSNVGPYSPPPGCDLQTFVTAVARLSNDLLLMALAPAFGPNGLMLDRIESLGHRP